MTRLLALSFDAPASPGITLRWDASDQAGEGRKAGWGVAWYPPQEAGAVVVKDPTSVGDDAMTALLRNWPRFRSTVFVGHLHGAARRTAQEDTHPFERRYAGRSWVLTHNGWLEPGYRERLSLGSAPMQEPVGHTDSEHVLCWLLARLRRARARCLGDVGWPRLLRWFGEVNAEGTFNVLFTDGLDVVVYQDRAHFNPLHYCLRRPPHAEDTLSNESILLDLSDGRDQNRSAVMVATDPLSGGEWHRLEPGRMLVMRRGAVTWDSRGEGAESPPRRVAEPAQPARPDPQQAAQAYAEPPVACGTGEAERLYRIHHATSYEYGEQVERSTHLLRLRPVHDRLQQLLEFQVSVDPATHPHAYDDVFGNEVASFDLESPYASLRLVASSLVRVHAENRRVLHSPTRRSAIPLVWMPWQRQMMAPYLLSHELPEVQLRELFDYAMGFVERQDYDLTETLLDMNRTIFRDYAYVQGSTTVETTPFEVYTNRKGVCQDFANLLICMARLLGVPARYRVGYIHTSKDYENTLQSDASHAWAELYLPWFGWQGFDPTNGCLAGLDHVRVACGRNYRDATPTSGTIFQGGRGEQLSIEVRVERADGATPAPAPPVPN